METALQLKAERIKDKRMIEIPQEKPAETIEPKKQEKPSPEGMQTSLI